jgi:hypothetical protein
MSEKVTRAPKLVTVSERNLQNAAVRLLPKHNKLVSPEVDYLRRVLGEKATQREIEEKILQVRKLPWSEIVRE